RNVVGLAQVVTFSSRTTAKSPTPRGAYLIPRMEFSPQVAHSEELARPGAVALDRVEGPDRASAIALRQLGEEDFDAVQAVREHRELPRLGVDPALGGVERTPRFGQIGLRPAQLRHR